MCFSSMPTCTHFGLPRQRRGTESRRRLSSYPIDQLMPRQVTFVPLSFSMRAEPCQCPGLATRLTTLTRFKLPIRKTCTTPAPVMVSSR